MNRTALPMILASCMALAACASHQEPPARKFLLANAFVETWKVGKPIVLLLNDGQVRVTMARIVPVPKPHIPPARLREMTTQEVINDQITYSVANLLDQTGMGARCELLPRGYAECWTRFGTTGPWINLADYAVTRGDAVYDYSVGQ